MIETYSNGINEYYDEKGNRLFTVINHYEEDAHYFDNGQMAYVGREVTAHYKKMTPEQAEIEFSHMYKEFERQQEINRNIEFVHHSCKKEAELAQVINELPAGSHRGKAESAYQDYLLALANAIKTEKTIQDLEKQIADLRNANPWKKTIDAYHRVENAIDSNTQQSGKMMTSKEKRETDPQWIAIRASAQFLTKHGDRKTARTLVQSYLKAHEKE